MFYTLSLQSIKASAMSPKLTNYKLNYASIHFFLLLETMTIPTRSFLMTGQNILMSVRGGVLKLNIKMLGDKQHRAQ